MLILLRDVDLYAPEALGRGDLLLAGGRLVSVGPRLEPPRGIPCEIVDGHELIAAPGLVDVHAHLAGGGGEGGAHTKVATPAAASFAGAGVTTVVGLLGTDGTTRTIAELLAAARALEFHGLTARCYTGSYEVPPVTLTGSVRGDIVNVDRIVAVGEVAISDHRSSQPTFEELARIAADAHVAGLMTGKAGLLHLHLGDGPRGLELVRRIFRETELPVRTLHPTHLNRNPDLWREALQLAADHPAWLDVTGFPEGDESPAASACIAAYLAAGRDPARITCSSDGGGCLPVFSAEGRLERFDVGSPDVLLRTARELVDRGVPLATALAPLTRNPATLFRFERKGRLAVGADADVLLLDRHLAVRHVLAGGRFVWRDGAPVGPG